MASISPPLNSVGTGSVLVLHPRRQWRPGKVVPGTLIGEEIIATDAYGAVRGGHCLRGLASDLDSENSGEKRSNQGLGGEIGHVGSA